MELTGTHTIARQRSVVWKALMDLDTLQRAIPGCEEISGSVPTAISAVFTQAIGPITATVRVAASYAELDAPNRLVVTGSGRGGPASIARGRAEILLQDTPGGTEIRYHVRADIGGAFARTGLPVIERTAHASIIRFFDQIAAQPGVEETQRLSAPDTSSPIIPRSVLKSRKGGLAGKLWFLASKERRITREIRPHFDTGHYLRNNPDVAAARLDPVRHYTLFGAWEGRDPTEAFSTSHYLATHADVRAAAVNPFWHYIRFGKAENRSIQPGDATAPAGVADTAAEIAGHDPLALIHWHIDADFYRKRYGDAMNNGMGPAAYYLFEGWQQDHDPCEGFSTRYYLDSNADVRASGANPFVHFILHGQAEGRKPYPPERDALPLLQSLDQLEASGPVTLSDAHAGFDFAAEMAPRQVDVPIVLIDDPEINVETLSRRCRQALQLSSGNVLCLSNTTPEVTDPRLEVIRPTADPVGALCRCIASLSTESVILWTTGVCPSLSALPVLEATLRRAPGIAYAGANVIAHDFTILSAGFVTAADGSIRPLGVGRSALACDHFRLRTTILAEPRLAMARSAPLLAALSISSEQNTWLGSAQDLSLGLSASGAQVVHQGTAVAMQGPEAPALYQKQLDAGDALAFLTQQERVAATEKILFVDSAPLTPDRDAGSVTADNMLEIAQERGADVWFYADSNRRFDCKYTARLALKGIGCLYRPDYPDLTPVLERPDLQGAHRATVVLTRVHSGGRYLETVRRALPKAKIIFNTVDLHGLRERREAAQRGNAADAFRAQSTLERETAIVAGADSTIVLSELEKSELEQTHGFADIRLIPMINEPHRTQAGFEARAGLLFVGSFLHAPNVDAIEYFCSDVWPLIRAKRPEMTLRIAGAEFPEWLAQRLPDGVELLGFIPELAAEMDRAAVTIAPLRYGAGIKGKIGTSLSHGVPCVASPAAAEGMGLVNGRDILIADDRQGFADAVIRLTGDAELWSALSRRGFETFEARYSRAAVARLLNGLFDDLHSDLPALQPGVAA